MRAKTKLALEQTQQGVSDEVLERIEGVKELKRKVKIKGEKKEALFANGDGYVGLIFRVVYVAELMDTSGDLFSKYSSYIGPNKLSKSSVKGMEVNYADESSLLKRFVSGSKQLCLEAIATSNILHNAIMEAGGKDRPPMLAPGIDNDIYFTVDTCPNACGMWKDIVRLKQGESINVQDLETNLYWEFRKFTSRDGESLESYYLRFYKMMNELVRNQCDVTNHQVNVQFVLQLQPEWQRSQQAATRNRGKEIVNSPPPIYDQEPSMVAEDDEMSKDKEIDKLMALIPLSFKKIYKPTNNNLRTSSNTSIANQDNSLRIRRGTGYDNQRIDNVVRARENVARECQKPKRVKDAAYHKEKMLLCKQEETGFQLNAKQANWKDDTDDKPKDQELEAHYMYMAKLQEVTPDAADNSRPIFDSETLQQNDDDALANERELLASLIEKLKCEIDDSKNRNKFLETSNKVLVDKLKGEIEDFKTKNKSLESSNNRFKEANNELSKTNELMYNDLKKFQAELDRLNDVEYALKMEIDCAKAKRDLISYKMESQKLFNKYNQKINVLNQTISKMKKELSAHQETISILSQAKEAQIKLYKTHEDKELDTVIALENKVKVLDNIVYKTGQLSQISTGNSKNTFLNEIDQLSREYYYADHMNAILAMYTKLDEVTNLQCDYLKTLDKCECLEKELSRSKIMSNSFEALQKHAINLELELQQCHERIKNGKSFKENQSKEFHKEREQYFEIQDLKAQLQDKGIVIGELKKLIAKPKGKSVDTKFEKSSVIRQPNAFKSQRQSILGKPTTFSDSLERKDCSKSKPQLKCNQLEDRVMLNNSQGKKQKVEDHRRNVKFSKNKTSVTTCNDSLNAKTSDVNCVCVTCEKCVLNEKHDMCVLNSINGVNSRTKMPMAVPVSSREPKRIVNQFVAKPLRRTIASESTNQKPRQTNRKLYEHVSKACSWWYPKFTPPGYKWKPKSKIGNVNPNVSMPLGNASRTANILEPMTPGIPLCQIPHCTLILLQLIEIILFIIDSGCSKQMTRNLKLLTNFVEKFMGTVKFGNDQIAPILGYGDLHRRLSHLNFDTINLLSKNNIVIGLPKVKFIKDHLCSSCELGKAKRKSFLTKTTPSSKRRLQLLHTDLCGPTLVESFNGKKYVLVIVDDYSRYTWTHFLRTVRTDKGTEFLNKALHAYFAVEGINHQTSVARTPEQNGVVKRRNRTLVEAARTMLSAAKVALDGENLDKMKEKGDAFIFVGYSTQSIAYRVFYKRTRVIVETIHVNFDELLQMASDHVSSDPVPQCRMTIVEHDSLSPGSQCQENVHQKAATVTTSNELDLLFSLMFDELLNGSNQAVSKSSDVPTADAPHQCQQQLTTPLNTQTIPELTCQVPSQAPTITTTENINQAESNSENAQVEDDEFINIFCTLVQDRGETSFCHVDSSNMHTFYQRHPSKNHWTKDHPLEQVIGNPS
nr:hypothetical protein [Tanacetum cinerariifolium]